MLKIVKITILTHDIFVFIDIDSGNVFQFIFDKRFSILSIISFFIKII